MRSPATPAWWTMGEWFALGRWRWPWITYGGKFLSSHAGVSRRQKNWLDMSVKGPVVCIVGKPSQMILMCLLINRLRSKGLVSFLIIMGVSLPGRSIPMSWTGKKSSVSSLQSNSSLFSGEGRWWNYVKFQASFMCSCLWRNASSP